MIPVAQVMYRGIVVDLIAGGFREENCLLRLDADDNWARTTRCSRRG